jgi:hypothetical protein
LSFLEPADRNSLKPVSKSVNKETSAIDNLLHKKQLKNLLLFKFREDENRDKRVAEKMETLLDNDKGPYPYTAAFKRYRYELGNELLDLGYPFEYIDAITPEVLGTAPVIQIPSRGTTDYIDYFRPQDVPLGISRGVDPLGRPAIIFNFHYDNMDGTWNDDVSVHHKRYINYTCWTTGNRSSNYLLLGAVQGFESRDPQANMEKGGVFYKILRSYRDSILNNKTVVPIEVSYPRNNQLDFATVSLQPNRYDLCLISDLSEDKIPKHGKIYLDMDRGGLLTYTCLDPRDETKTVTGALQLSEKIDALTPELLGEYKSVWLPVALASLKELSRPAAKYKDRPR